MKTAFILIFMAWVIPMCVNVVLVAYIHRDISRKIDNMFRRNKDEEEMS